MKKKREQCDLEIIGFCDKTSCVVCGKNYIPYRDYREKISKIKQKLNLKSTYREKLLHKIIDLNIDYLKKLCWTDEDIKCFLRQYKNL